MSDVIKDLYKLGGKEDEKAYVVSIDILQWNSFLPFRRVKINTILKWFINE